MGFRQEILLKNFPEGLFLSYTGATKNMGDI